MREQPPSLRHEAGGSPEIRQDDGAPVIRTAGVFKVAGMVAALRAPVDEEPGTVLGEFGDESTTGGGSAPAPTDLAEDDEVEDRQVIGDLLQ